MIVCFQFAKIDVDILSMSFKVKNWVGNKLSWAVKGGFAPAANLKPGHFTLPERF